MKVKQYPRGVVKRLVPGEWVAYIIYAPTDDFSGADPNVDVLPDGFSSQQGAMRQVLTDLTTGVI